MKLFATPHLSLSKVVTGSIGAALCLSAALPAQSQKPIFHRGDGLFNRPNLGAALLFAQDIVVSNDKDSGAGSLRDAITRANASNRHSKIRFELSPDRCLFIHPTSPLPPVTANGTIIEGTVGKAHIEFGNVILSDLRSYEGPLIYVVGDKAGFDANGLVIQANDCAVRGLVINGFGESQVWINGGKGNSVTGCYIGALPDAHFPFASGPSGNGVDGDLFIDEKENSSSSARGSSSSSGSAGSIRAGGILSRLPGRAAIKIKDIPLVVNHGAVFVSGGAHNTVIGGIGAGNIIGNGTEKVAGLETGDGVFVSDATTTGTTIRGNLITTYGGRPIGLSPNMQGVPVLTGGGSGSQVPVRGTFAGASNTKFALDFTTNRGLIGTTEITTNAQGQAKFNLKLGVPSVPDQAISASATNLQTGDTGQFSEAKPVGGVSISGKVVNSANGYGSIPFWGGVTLTLSKGTVIIGATESTAMIVNFGGNSATNNAGGGDFHFYHIGPGDYTLTATRRDLVINPISRAVTVGSADIVNMDFAGTQK